MRLKFIAAALFLGILPTTFAQEPADPWKVGLNLWLADIDYDFGNGSESGDSRMFGPTVSYTWPGKNWISLSYATSEEDYRNGSTDVDTVDALFGHTVSVFDFGAGARYWMNEYSSGSDDMELGPIVYLGAASPIAGSAIGVYGYGTWNPVDFGDDEDAQHYTLDGGFSLGVKQVQARIGYRYKDYYDIDGSFKYSGPTVTFAAMF